MRQILLGPVPTANFRQWSGEKVLVEVLRRIPDASLRTDALGATQLISLRCGTATISRSEPDPASSRARALTFIFQNSGRSELTHYGRRTALAAGDASLCDNSAPYRLEIEGPAELILFRVPLTMVKEHLPTPDRFCGSLLAGEQSLTSTAIAMAADLSRRLETSLDADSCERAARYLLEVICCSFKLALGRELPVSSLMTRHLWRVKLHVEQHLRDPELSPSSIAQQLKISDRYLRLMFAANNETLSSYILHRRLEECARMLRDRAWRGHSITEISFSWGFNSAPHFARRFRACFGISPSDYRNLDADTDTVPGASNVLRLSPAAKQQAVN